MLVAVVANLLSALVWIALVASFTRLSTDSDWVYKLLLTAVPLIVMLASFNLFVLLRQSRRVDEVATGLSDLKSSIATIDWVYDSAEHDSNVFSKMWDMVRDQRTLTLKIATVWRDPKPTDSRPRDAISAYYKEIEAALVTRRDFHYERLVVMRGAFGDTRGPKELFDGIMSARPEFADHCWNVLVEPLARAIGAKGEILFFGDTGRLVDVAFAVSLDRSGIPLKLVLEIGTTAHRESQQGSRRPALGLLSIENPSSSLADAFLATHQALRSPTAVNVDHISNEDLRAYLRRTRGT